VEWDWVHLLSRPLLGLLYQSQMLDDDECGAVGGMRIGRGNRSIQRKPAPVPFCHHKSHITWPGLEPGPMVGSQQLTAWAMAQPIYDTTFGIMLTRHHKDHLLPTIIDFSKLLFWNVSQIYNYLLFKWAKYCKIFYVNYVKFSLILFAPEDGQARPKHVGL
jgi:hypothetical protein